MITLNEPLAAIQARREELHHTITEKEEQITMRTREFAATLKREISPVNIIRKHPVKAASAAFLSGLLLTRALPGKSCHSTRVEYREQSAPSHLIATPSKTALSTIGYELLRSVKDLGFTYLQRYLEKKIR